MRTLKELNDAMRSGDDAVARAAATELANFYIVYNEEYNLLQDMLILTHGQYVVVTQSGAGLDHAKAMALSALELSLQARMALLDQRMRAFHMSDMAISPPDAATVSQVKTLSAKVAELARQNAAINAISQALTDVAYVVNKSW